MEDLDIDEKFVRATQAKPLSAVAGSYTFFADGDVLLAKITPCFENGKLGIADGLTNGIGFGSSEYIVFRPSSALNKEYLYYYLSREIFRVEGAARMSGAVGHKRVAKEFIEGYPIPIPHFPNSGGSSESSTKRLTASPLPKPRPKRTSETPAPSSKATSNPSLPSAARGGSKRPWKR
jgi:hypothetical protein